MGRKKYNHQVGDTYVEHGSYLDSTRWYMLRHIVQIEQDETKGEMITLFCVATSSGGKFRNTLSQLKRTSFNTHVRRSIKLSEFTEQYRLEFLITVGCSVNEMIERAKERHSKHSKRHMIQVTPDSIQIPEV